MIKRYDLEVYCFLGLSGNGSDQKIGYSSHLIIGTETGLLKKYRNGFLLFSSPTLYSKSLSNMDMTIAIQTRI